jgi:hypothetical protein
MLGAGAMVCGGGASVAGAMLCGEGDICGECDALRIKAKVPLYPLFLPVEAAIAGIVPLFPFPLQI